MTPKSCGTHTLSHIHTQINKCIHIFSCLKKERELSLVSKLVRVKLAHGSIYCHKEKQETPELSIGGPMTKQIPDTHSVKHCAAYRARRLLVYRNDQEGKDEKAGLLWTWQALCEAEAAATLSVAPTTKGFPGETHVCIHRDSCHPLTAP